jgi:hypothetical protein
MHQKKTGISGIQYYTLYETEKDILNHVKFKNCKFLGNLKRPIDLRNIAKPDLQVDQDKRKKKGH